MPKVELYERIRRDRARYGWSIRQLSRVHGVHRREVRQALANAVPSPRKEVVRARPVLGPLTARIDAILAADREAPRKQRHTAKRICERLREEEGAEVAERTVRGYVRQRKREIWGVREVMVPLYHEPGQEAEVDLGESVVEFPWGREKVAIFEMRACASGAVFRWPMRNQQQQGFLEAHVHAFEYFGAVFAKVKYDNLKLAVVKVLQGRRRQETERFKAMRSHYLFESRFCRPGIAGAHEKGGIEGEVGYGRRNHLVPVPRVEGWRELEELCLCSSMKELSRRLAGREQTVGERWELERELLRALPPDEFDTLLRAKPVVDEKGRVTVLRNRYSVPVVLCGLSVEVEVSSPEVVVRHRGVEVARHERLYGIGKDRLVLDHYLEVLRYKPGAFGQSLPLKQAVDDGSFPASYQQLWHGLVERHGESEGARQMVDVLFLHRRHPQEEVHRAVEEAVATGACEFGAVALLVRGSEVRERPRAPHLEVIENPQVPVPDCTEYDRLLRLEVVG